MSCATLYLLITSVPLASKSIKLDTLTMPMVGEIFPGFGYDNTIIVWMNGTTQLKQYKFENGHFSQVQTADLPGNCSDFIYKHTVSSGQTYMTQKDRNGKSELGIYDQNLVLQERLACEGLLLAVVDDKWLVFDNKYAVDRGEKGCEIYVKSMRDLSVVHKLDIKCRYDKEDWPRACGHPHNGKIAVVAREKERLDVFDENGTRFCQPVLEAYR